MKRQVLVADMVQFNANPSSHPHVRRVKKCVRVLFDQERLVTGRHWNPYRDMPIIVMITREHGIDLFPHEKGRLAV